MAWSGPNVAMPFLEDGVPLAWPAVSFAPPLEPGLAATSITTSVTSPIALPGLWWVCPPSALVFGLHEWQFDRAENNQGRTVEWSAYTTAPSVTCTASPLPGLYPASDYLLFLEVEGTVVTSSTGALSLSYDLAIDPVLGTGPAPLVATCVPTQYASPISADVEVIEYIALLPTVDSSGWPSVGLEPFMVLATEPCTFYVRFKDPSVVELPVSMGGAGYVTDPSDLLPADPGTSVAAIVGFHSEDPTFRTGVTGPFLLVDSLDAIPDQTGDHTHAPHYRLWLGVPSAAVAPSGGTGPPALHVYFVIEPARRTDLRGVEMPPPLDCLKGQDLDVWIDIADPGKDIAVKRIEGVDVRDEIARGGKLMDEATWTTASAVTGTLLGKVRILFPSDPPRLIVHSFEEEFPAGGSPPRKVDPAAFTVGSTLHLAFCAREGDMDDIRNNRITGTNGHGIWHAVAIDDGVVLLDRNSMLATDPIVYGRDFLSRASPPGSGWYPDQIAVSFTSPSMSSACSWTRTCGGGTEAASRCSRGRTCCTREPLEG